jgi:flagellar hook-associated protein 1 FlgK
LKYLGLASSRNEEPLGTLASLMDLSSSALQADQIALDVTSNNVANQNTVGYTRQVVNWQTQDVVTLGAGTISGVSVASTSSQRDRVLEQRVQQQTQAQSQSSEIDSGLQQIENVFGLSSTGTSASTTVVGSAIDSFFSGLSALVSNPSDVSTRQNVISAATSLASAFNSAAGQLSDLSSGLNQQVASVVGEINSLASSVADLNGKIAALSPGKDAGVLEDQRQATIAQLSKYVGLDQVSTEQNGITLTMSDGSVLVGGDVAYAVGTTSVGGSTHVLAGVAGTDVTAGISGGQLGGILAVRDQKLPQVASVLDSLAYGIASQVNAQNGLGTDGYGNPGQPLFSLAGGVSGAAGSIAMATTDPLVVAAAAPGEGASGSGNAQALADLSTGNIVGGTTATSFYASLLGQIGSDAASATTDNTVQQTTLTQLTTQRDSLSGVSLDQEAANLTQYQRSYEAAAKVFSIVNSIMASALNLGEPTTVA